MIPGLHVEQRPDQLRIYARGTQGAGAVPGAGATFNVPLFATASSAVEDYLNAIDGSIKASALLANAHGLRRYVGLWYVDVFVFQDGPATIELRERPPDLVTQALGGLVDTTRRVWVRQVMTSRSFHQTWRLCASEVRLVYLNGATAITTFALDVIARAA